MSNEMHLVVLLRGAGMHEASWRHPSVDPSAIWDPRHYVAMSVLAERGHLDGVFITDELSSPAGQGGDDAVGRFEPLTLLSFVDASARSSLALHLNDAADVEPGVHVRVAGVDVSELVAGCDQLVEP